MPICERSGAAVRLRSGRIRLRSLACEAGGVAPDVGVPEAANLDSQLRMSGLSATEAPRIADELHTMSAVAGLSLSDTVQAFVTLLGGAVPNGEQGPPDG